MKRKIKIALVALGLSATAAFADDIDVVKGFYNDLLTTPADATAEAVNLVLAENWVGEPVAMGGPGAAGWVNTLGAFGQLIPDLEMTIDEILQVDNRYIVRAHATGTPVGPFLGIDPATGNSFDIMTIDIHTVEDGKIATTYHIEEWATALQQLTEK